MRGGTRRRARRGVHLRARGRSRGSMHLRARCRMHLRGRGVHGRPRCGMHLRCRRMYLRCRRMHLRDRSVLDRCRRMLYRYRSTHFRPGGRTPLWTRRPTLLAGRRRRTTRGLRRDNARVLDHRCAGPTSFDRRGNAGALGTSSRPAWPRDTRRGFPTLRSRSARSRMLDWWRTAALGCWGAQSRHRTWRCHAAWPRTGHGVLRTSGRRCAATLWRGARALCRTQGRTRGDAPRRWTGMDRGTRGNTRGRLRPGWRWRQMHPLRQARGDPRRRRGRANRLRADDRPRRRQGSRIDTFRDLTHRARFLHRPCRHHRRRTAVGEVVDSDVTVVDRREVGDVGAVDRAQIAIRAVVPGIVRLARTERAPADRAGG